MSHCCLCARDMMHHREPGKVVSFVWLSDEYEQWANEQCVELAQCMVKGSLALAMHLTETCPPPVG